MKLSTKGRYGLRALIDLAQYSGEAPVSITSISSRQDISERYLEQLMAMLKKAGIVSSVRGAGGGYILAKDMKDISAGDILRALEGSLEPVDCPGLEPDGGMQSCRQLCDKICLEADLTTALTGQWMKSCWISSWKKAGKSAARIRDSGCAKTEKYSNQHVRQPVCQMAELLKLWR